MTAPVRVLDEVDEIRRLASPLHEPADLDPLIARLADADIVMLGEASHGTAEYYGWRATISRRLIEDHGFDFVAVEGDWPDCYRINRWVRGDGAEDARTALLGYERWPRWMWSNEEVAAFIAWLRVHNGAGQEQAGFYGLDVYSLWESLHAVFQYVQRYDPEALPHAIAAARCFEPYREDPQAYAWSTVGIAPEGCRAEVVNLLVEMRRRVAAAADDDQFDALQNAEVLADAERYYRTMVRGDSESWNVRDRHMADTLDRLLQHHGPGAKGIVWAHNTHVGDARATDMAAAGMVNIGQLGRERHPDEDVVLVGFAGHRGTVLAGDFWGAPGRIMTVPSSYAGSHEAMLHEAVGEPSLMVFTDERDGPWLSAVREHRAIGVVYRPAAERRGNWVPTLMGRRYDALLFFDDTRALRALQPEPLDWPTEAETYPWSV